MIERAGAVSLMLHHAVVSKASVERAHELGVAVWAWTVDDAGELARLDAAGVDAVISNDPRLFAQGMGSAKADPIPREDP
jgi:glycerophosphoryl diester phosphodiesterase